MDTFTELAKGKVIFVRCGPDSETVAHFLLRCTQWDRERRDLIEKVGPLFGNLSHMLGGKPQASPTEGQVVEPEKSTWKPDLKVIKAVIKFARETQRLASNA
jgi:hypothetical protein